MRNTQANSYNYEAFTPDEVEKGLHLKLINLLLELNKYLDNGCYYDIHITSDSYCTIIEWKQCNPDFDDPAFEYVGEDEQVMKIVRLPDDTIQYALDDDEVKEILDEFLKEHPYYHRNEYGRWVNEKEVVDLSKCR